eukprot:scaffold5479_cov199-Amphora_coffeaeformis.AAC.106
MVHRCYRLVGTSRAVDRQIGSHPSSTMFFNSLPLDLAAAASRNQPNDARRILGIGIWNVAVLDPTAPELASQATYYRVWYCTIPDSFHFGVTTWSHCSFGPRRGMPSFGFLFIHTLEVLHYGTIWYTYYLCNYPSFRRLTWASSLEHPLPYFWAAPIDHTLAVC